MQTHYVWHFTVHHLSRPERYMTPVIGFLLFLWYHIDIETP
jgi:hypothetical protein